MKPFFAAIALFAALLAAGAAEYRIECEVFSPAPDVQSGRWGSASGEAYLKMGKKDAAAVRNFTLPESGDYFVWVRDFTLCGKFRTATVFCNGNRVGKFGDERTPDGKPGVWQWNCSPQKVHLDAGKLEIKIVSGSNYTRLDAMILAADEKFTPGSDVAAIPALQLITE